jgi:hypothetical protein
VLAPPRAHTGADGYSSRTTTTTTTTTTISTTTTTISTTTRPAAPPLSAPPTRHLPPADAAAAAEEHAVWATHSPNRVSALFSTRRTCGWVIQHCWWVERVVGNISKKIKTHRSKKRDFTKADTAVQGIWLTAFTRWVRWRDLRWRKAEKAKKLTAFSHPAAACTNRLLWRHRNTDMSQYGHMAILNTMYCIWHTRVRTRVPWYVHIDTCMAIPSYWAPKYAAHKKRKDVFSIQKRQQWNFLLDAQKRTSSKD